MSRAYFAASANFLVTRCCLGVDCRLRSPERARRMNVLPLREKKVMSPIFPRTPLKRKLFTVAIKLFFDFELSSRGAAKRRTRDLNSLKHASIFTDSGFGHSAAPG